MPSSPVAITVHGQQPSRPRSTFQTRRHSSPQSPSTAAHQDPSQATTAVLVHCPCPMPTRHRVRHQHHDQPTSATLDPTPRPPVRDPQTASMVRPQRPWICGPPLLPLFRCSLAGLLSSLGILSGIAPAVEVRSERRNSLLRAFPGAPRPLASQQDTCCGILDKL
ncbi:unnamed protein product [Pleuronectes platessa]|uniref:Uncharacterized protein n=1 Tax=Pleuronectes platessa TaxID=8262 RepID=A0A9N7YS55_PLEPL|nr:unnamed protein product [Pleuronectes platessa]